MQSRESAACEELILGERYLVTRRSASRTPRKHGYSARLSPPRNQKGRGIGEPGSAASSFRGIRRGPAVAGSAT